MSSPRLFNTRKMRSAAINIRRHSRDDDNNENYQNQSVMRVVKSVEDPYRAPLTASLSSSSKDKKTYGTLHHSLIDQPSYLAPFSINADDDNDALDPDDECIIIQPDSFAEDSDDDLENNKIIDNNQIVTKKSPAASLTASPAEESTPLLKNALSNASTNNANSSGNPLGCCQPTVVATSILAFISALQTAVYPFTGASGHSPEDISWKWLRSLTPKLAVACFSLLITSTIVNYYVNKHFIPAAFRTFRKDIKHTFDSVGTFIDNALTLLLTLSGCAILIALGYSAWVWLPFGTVLAIMPMTLDLISKNAGRFVSIKTLIKTVRHRFNEDIQLQKQAAALLLKHKANLQEAYGEAKASLININIEHDNHKPLTEDQINQITRRLLEKLNELTETGEVKICQKKSMIKQVCYWLSLFAKVLLGLFVVFIPIFLVFTQKAYDGISLLDAGIRHLEHKEPVVPKWDIWDKRVAGGSLALTATTLYLMSSNEIPSTLYSLKLHLQRHPKDILPAAVLFLINILAAYSMPSVFNGITKNEHNIIGINSTSKLKIFLEACIALETYLVNVNASIKAKFLSAPLAHDASYEQFAHHVHSTNNFQLPNETINQLRQLSLFQPKPSQPILAQTYDQKTNSTSPLSPQ